jgi:AraC-like DNA-binding protein
MAADTLSDVLKTVRMTGAAFFSVSAKAPWVAEQLSREAVLPMILPGAEHMISYHVVTEGSCYATVIGGESYEVKAGQVVVFTRGDAHVMSSAPGMRAEPLPRDAIPPGTPLPYRATFGAEGPPSAKLVCGFLACDARPFNPLIENLPRVMIGDTAASGTMPWLAELVRYAWSEVNAGVAGSETILGKLTELMFIEVVRQHIDKMPADQAGWLAGLRDPVVSKALSLMHAAPADDWNVGSLARAAGASRSEFAERFACFVGIPPMQYLAKWRMQLASGLLANDVNIGVVAADVGYGSEASFSRAFKKLVGVPPSVWRDKRLAA